jgi:hypothetical protein
LKRFVLCLFDSEREAEIYGGIVPKINILVCFSRQSKEAAKKTKKTKIAKEWRKAVEIHFVPPFSLLGVKFYAPTNALFIQGIRVLVFQAEHLDEIQMRGWFAGVGNWL